MATFDDVARMLDEEPHDADHIQQWLERALNPRHVVFLLVEDLGFPDEAIATMTDVHEGSVRRWRSRDPDIGEPRPPQAKAIERIRAIAWHFVQSRAMVDLKGVGAWFVQINPGLREGSEAPADAVMTAERFEEILRLAKEFTRPGAGMAVRQGASRQPSMAGYGPPGAAATRKGP